MKFTSMLLILVSVTAFSANDRNWEETVAVDGNVRFHLESHKGKIQITAGEHDSISISAHVYLKNGSGDFSEEQVQRALQAVEFKLNQRSHSVSLKVDFDREVLDDLFAGLLGKNQEHPTVDLEISLPSEASLSLSSHKAQIEIDAPAGEIQLEIHKASVSIRNVRSDFSLENHKGTVDVEIRRLNSVSIESHKGNVDLTVHGAQDFRIEAESKKGNLTFKGFEIPVTRGKKESEVDFTQGTGDHLMQLETHKGNITVDFVD